MRVETYILDNCVLREKFSSYRVLRAEHKRQQVALLRGVLPPISDDYKKSIVNDSINTESISVCSDENHEGDGQRSWSRQYTPKLL